MSGWFTLFTNGRYVLNGELVEDHLVISDETGMILKREGYIGGEAVDLEDNIIAPGYLELHTNGVNGFHFTQLDDTESYNKAIDETAKHYATQGVTGFWATLPTVAPKKYQRTLYHLNPRDIPGAASLLGAHCEGPFLHPSKKGAHAERLLAARRIPAGHQYGTWNVDSSIKLVTVAPELPNLLSLIDEFTDFNIRVSLGHSNATFAEGLAGLKAGATCLTHVLNAMSPFTSREPGLAGLISLPPTHVPAPPYFTLIADGEHLHPNTVSLLYNSNPKKAIIITDSIELASQPDGTYPGNFQIESEQIKKGNRATIAGTDTLIGGCISLQQGVRNVMQWTGCGVAQAACSVTENVAGFMGIDGPGGRGILKEGRRADLCVLNEQGDVLQTWIAGHKVWDKEEEIAAKEADGESRG